MRIRKLVNWKKQGATAIIIIDNPPVNVVDDEVRQEMTECLAEAKDDGEVITIVITGAGEKALMAGADIRTLPDLVKKDGGGYGLAKKGYVVWDFLEALQKPTIVAINGLALGAGCEMSLACDIRIADEKAKFGLPEVKLGFFPGGGGTQRLPKIVGKAKAKELMYTGEPITAQEALRIGLVNQVVPHGESLNYALAMAEKINTKSRPALCYIKNLVNISDLPIAEGLEQEAQFLEQAFHNDDVEEGVNAFIEKRKPKFQHK